MRHRCANLSLKKPRLFGEELNTDGKYLKLNNELKKPKYQYKA